MTVPVATAPGRRRRRFLVIHNPVAGLRRRQLFAAVIDRLFRAGAVVDVVTTANAEMGIEHARAAARDPGFDAVVAAGGDSTVRGAAIGLLGSELPLGIVPVGTGNVMAAELGLGRSATAIADTLLAGRLRDIGFATANGAPFLLMAGIGFDGRVIARLDQGLKRRIGKLAYVGPILSSLGDRGALDLTIDGVAYRCGWVVATSARYYAGRLVLSPGKQLGDGSLHFVLFDEAGAIGRMRQLLWLLAGRSASAPGVRIVVGQRCRVAGSGFAPVQLDGEAAGSGPVEIAIAPGRVRLIGPSQC